VVGGVTIYHGKCGSVVETWELHPDRIPGRGFRRGKLYRAFHSHNRVSIFVRVGSVSDGQHLNRRSHCRLGHKQIAGIRPYLSLSLSFSLSFPVRISSRRFFCSGVSTPLTSLSRDSLRSLIFAVSLSISSLYFP